MRTWGTWKVRHSGTQEWQIHRYNYQTGKDEIYPRRFDMRMFATEKAKELNRAAKEAQYGNA